MTAKRSYGDPCGVARGLDLVGERWALLVVRELLLGPKRFSDLRTGLPHVSADVLAQRLRELEQSGVLRRTKLPPPAAARVYELTEWGRELEPLVLALGRWGSQAPFPDSDMPLGADALMIALKTRFDPATAALGPAVVEIKLAEERFVVAVEAGRLEVQRGGAPEAEARIETDPATLAAVLWHGRSLEEGGVHVEGDRDAVERFLSLFPAPEPVA